MAVSAAVVWLPLTARLPLQPPDAAHDVALMAFQASVVVPPLAMAEGVAVRVTAGDGGWPVTAVTVTVAEFGALVPPLPVHVIE